MSLLLEPRIRSIRLHELHALAARLVTRVIDSGFQPTCIIYVERAARLLAASACAQLSIGAVPLVIQRKPDGGKGRLPAWLATCPVWLKNLLRHVEARLVWRRASGKRHFSHPPCVDLSGCRVLLLDDAVDTGSTVRMARAWALEQGAQDSDIRVAALTVSTSLGVDAVDFTLYRQMCRFPWSSDSNELQAYEQAYREAHVPTFHGLHPRN